jgi:hypothetical protein
VYQGYRMLPLVRWHMERVVTVKGPTRAVAQKDFGVRPSGHDEQKKVNVVTTVINLD